MNCNDIQTLLSAHHDGELSTSMESRVREHIRSCKDCKSQLDHLRRLSALVTRDPDPVIPSSVWPAIREQLDRRPTTTPRFSFGGVLVRSRWRSIALAASVLIAVGIGWTMLPGTLTDPHLAHHQVAQDLDRYIERFQRDPDAAQRFLEAKYANTRIAPEEAIQMVGYRPAVAAGLPDGYTIASTHVMTMPCCTCVQSICRRRDGSCFTIFEHGDDEVLRLGDRPETQTMCAGKECCLVNLDDRLAATWKRDGRYITLIGVRDRAEVDHMVAWLDKAGMNDEPSVSR